MLQKNVYFFSTLCKWTQISDAIQELDTTGLAVATSAIYLEWRIGEHLLQVLGCVREPNTIILHVIQHSLFLYRTRFTSSSTSHSRVTCDLYLYKMQRLTYIAYDVGRDFASSAVQCFLSFSSSRNNDFYFFFYTESLCTELFCTLEAPQEYVENMMTKRVLM